MALLRVNSTRALARVIRGMLLALLVLSGSLPAAEPKPTISPEYQVKAVFLFNFAQFAEWPPEALGRPGSPFVIGILGDDPFGSYLDDLVRDEEIGGRRLVIHRCRELVETQGCHLLFISRSEAPRMEMLLRNLRNRSVLTVSDVEPFARAGGMVQFLMEDRKVRLRINVLAAKACGLTISSKIQRPATIVTTGKD